MSGPSNAIKPLFCRPVRDARETGGEVKKDEESWKQDEVNFRRYFSRREFPCDTMRPV